MTTTMTRTTKTETALTVLVLLALAGILIACAVEFWWFLKE